MRKHMAWQDDKWTPSAAVEYQGYGGCVIVVKTMPCVVHTGHGRVATAAAREAREKAKQRRPTVTHGDPPTTLNISSGGKANEKDCRSREEVSKSLCHLMLLGS
jgi:hypothetical protein